MISANRRLHDWDYTKGRCAGCARTIDDFLKIGGVECKGDVAPSVPQHDYGFFSVFCLKCGVSQVQVVDGVRSATCEGKPSRVSALDDIDTIVRRRAEIRREEDAARNVPEPVMALDFNWPSDGLAQLLEDHDAAIQRALGICDATALLW